MYGSAEHDAKEWSYCERRDSVFHNTNAAESGVRSCDRGALITLANAQLRQFAEVDASGVFLNCRFKKPPQIDRLPLRQSIGHFLRRQPNQGFVRHIALNHVRGLTKHC